MDARAGGVRAIQLADSPHTERAEEPPPYPRVCTASLRAAARTGQALPRERGRDSPPLAERLHIGLRHAPAEIAAEVGGGHREAQVPARAAPVDQLVAGRNGLGLAV